MLQSRRRQLALYAFDGTWNDSSAPDGQRDQKKDTNVHRFRLRYTEKVEYKDGVGTRFGFIGKMVGGITGAGADKRVSEGFAALKQNFAEGDETVDIIGYSRGAAIARLFVHRIARDFDQIVARGHPLERPPTVRFLGLFDTVASFGVPWTADEHDFDPAIPKFVERTFHAMALDEARETFGIERCLGDRDKITEVWFRGGHGDIGGNATYVGHRGEVASNRLRSDIALDWMLAKARAAGLPMHEGGAKQTLDGEAEEAPVTAKSDPISIGRVGTLSRRIHIGDMVHYSVELDELTHGIDGRLLRRIATVTRIEDETLEQSADAVSWIPPDDLVVWTGGVERADEATPSIVHLSLRRYPFDVLPARTWEDWIRRWKIRGPQFALERRDEFWAPTDADRAFAWEVYVELMTRITVQELADDDGDDATALTSVYRLFDLSRESMKRHGVACANSAALVAAFLNERVRKFTAKWHPISLEEKWQQSPGTRCKAFRDELTEIQDELRELAGALSHLADARL